MKKFIATKQFYIGVLALTVPIMLQALLVSLSGYIDSLMINSYGGSNAAYNGVSAANRLMFLINYSFNGMGAVTSIFIAQFFGANKKEKFQETIRLSFLVALFFSTIAILVMMIFGNNIVNGFIKSSESRAYGYDYLGYMKYGVIFIGMNVALATVFRNLKKSHIALFAGIGGIVVNVFLNYALIFGNFGFKELGASGAAIGTVASKVIEFIVLIIAFIVIRNDYLKGTFKSLKIDLRLILNYIKKGMPLIMNEILWAMSQILFAKFYTYHNDLWYNAYAYAQNVSDLFYVIFQGLATAVAVYIGQTLGESRFDLAYKQLNWFRGFGVMVGLLVAFVMTITAPYIVLVFKPDYETKKLVIQILRVNCIFTAIYCFYSINFYALRAGGDTIRAFIVDQVPSYLLGIPLTIVLALNSQKLGINIVHIFLFSHISDITKVIIGSIFISQRKWLKNLTTQYNDDLILT